MKIKKCDTFNIKQTLDCGQVFRYTEKDGVFDLYAINHHAKITENDDEYVFECDDDAFFQKYLDFDTNYDIIIAKSQDKALISSAIAFGRGIHILRQDPIETIFSFLISQNNHIPRIKSIIGRICDALGDDMGEYHAFPTVQQLATKDAEWYASIGAGYRAEYLARNAKFFAENDIIGEWSKLPTEELRAKLMSLYGVGRKVADCVLLFGFARYDVFPVDTWILKVFEQDYPAVPAEKLSKLLVEKYGEMSGFIQQWLFYFKREEKKL